MTDATAATSMVAPELVSQIEDAPGQGILPGISEHLGAGPGCSTSTPNLPQPQMSR